MSDFAERFEVVIDDARIACIDTLMVDAADRRERLST